MSGSEKKFGKTLNESVSPSVEFEKILSRVGASRETIKEVERVINSPDSKTTVSYRIEVDQRTGAQKVVENFSTTMKACAICLNYVPQVFKCAHPDCGAFVCAKDKRTTDFGSFCLTCYESGVKQGLIRERGTDQW